MAEEKTTTDIYIGNIPKKTKKDDLLKPFEEFGVELDLYKGKKYAFIKVPNDKLDALLAKEYEVNGEKLEVNVARDPVPVIKYFLDTRMTKGALHEIDEEKVEEYFSQFGEVVKLNIKEGKGFGFLEMKKDEDNDEASGLAWKTHEIDGHTVNVKESTPFKRKRKGGKWKRRKRFKKN